MFVVIRTMRADYPIMPTPPSSGQKPDEGGQHNKEMHHALLL